MEPGPLYFADESKTIQHWRFLPRGRPCPLLYPDMTREADQRVTRSLSIDWFCENSHWRRILKPWPVPLCFG